MAPEPTKQSCAELLELLIRLGCALVDHSRARHELIAKMGVIPKDQYDRLKQQVQENETKCETAGSALDHHRSEHGC